MSQLSDPHLIEHIAHWEDSRAWYLIMELFGTSWREKDGQCEEAEGDESAADAEVFDIRGTTRGKGGDGEEDGEVDEWAPFCGKRGVNVLTVWPGRGVVAAGAAVALREAYNAAASAAAAAASAASSSTSTSSESMSTVTRPPPAPAAPVSAPAPAQHPRYAGKSVPKSISKRKPSTSSTTTSSTTSTSSTTTNKSSDGTPDWAQPVKVYISEPSCSSLFDFIEHHGGRMPRYLVPQLFRDLAEGLGYLHSQGIAHGDIKEENILVGFASKPRSHRRSSASTTTSSSTSATSSSSSSTAPRELVAKFCDFGHALRVKRNWKRLIRYGTREVSAPELVPNLVRAEWRKQVERERSGGKSKSKSGSGSDRAQYAMEVDEDEDEDDEEDEEEEEEEEYEQQRFHGFEQDVWALGLVLYTMIHGSLPRNILEFVSGELLVPSDMDFPYPLDNL
ncbi:hypothetical protein HK102_010219, partial [Quaeritorhiza haematococci]